MLKYFQKYFWKIEELVLLKKYRYVKKDTKKAKNRQILTA